MLFGLCCPFTSYLLRLLPSRGKDQERDLRVSAMKRPALQLLNLIAIHNKGLVVTTDNIYTVVLSMIILLGSPGYLRSVFTALSTMPTFCISTTAIKRGTTTATLFLASLCLSSKRCAAYTPKIGGIRRLSVPICAFRCIPKGTPKPKKTGENSVDSVETKSL